MAEIILPPEEETSQAPELNIDKPTENSKVITIEFEAKKTNKVSTKDTNQQLYTTDTDAWFEFKETSLEGANGTYSVVFRNRHDGSIFQRTGDVVSGVAYYKIPHEEIRHAGAWRGQVVYTLSNGDTTSREFGYDVKGHILDGKDVREIVVEDFETLMSQLRNMKDSAEVELANLVNTANQNETDRQAFFDGLVEDIDGLQANYQELLDTGVLQTNINTKLEALEEEYAPRLTEVTTQLAQKAKQSDLVVERARISNLTANAGDTDGNAELLDVRVGSDGTTYETAGEATRSLGRDLGEVRGVIGLDDKYFPDHLYLNGEEYPEKTGGWVLGKSTAVSEEFTKESDYLYLKNEVGAISGYTIVTTDNPIDLDGVEAIYVDWVQDVTTTSAQSYISATKDKDGDQISGIYERVTNSDTPPASERQVTKLDVSGLTGMHYIRIILRITGSNRNVSLKVFNVHFHKTSMAKPYALRGIVSETQPLQPEENLLWFKPLGGGE